jgi:hypothetical protein
MAHVVGFLRPTADRGKIERSYDKDLAHLAVMPPAKILSPYCDGAAQERLDEKFRNPLRIGYADRPKAGVLTLRSGREFRRAEFANNCHAGAGADAVGPSIDHRVGISGSPNPAGSFYASLIADDAAH